MGILKRLKSTLQRKATEQKSVTEHEILAYNRHTTTFVTQEQFDVLSKCKKMDHDSCFDNIKTIAKVVHVNDGDTVKVVFFYNGHLQQRPVRMLEYDSAEMHPKKKNRTQESLDREKKAALEAKEYLVQVIEETGNLVYARFYANDKWGRVLTKLWRLQDNPEVDKSINQMMIESGHGKKYDGGKKEAFV
jgi:endonuclease YncB( thermonuclease family)